MEWATIEMEIGQSEMGSAAMEISQSEIVWESAIQPLKQKSANHK